MFTGLADLQHKIGSHGLVNVQINVAINTSPETGNFSRDFVDPGGSSGTLKSPSPSVCTSRVAFVPWLRTVIWAFGITAALGSVTVPTIVPVGPTAIAWPLPPGRQGQE